MVIFHITIAALRTLGSQDLFYVMELEFKKVIIETKNSEQYTKIKNGLVSTVVTNSFVCISACKLYSAIMSSFWIFFVLFVYTIGIEAVRQTIVNKKNLQNKSFGLTVKWIYRIKLFSFSTGYFIKEIENIFSVLSYRNTCGKN